jgi:hypothetical protein
MGKAHPPYMPERRGIERGIELFRYLVDLARQGSAIGIPYGGFIAHLHGVDEFRTVAGRPYAPSDNAAVITIAYIVTDEAGGRQNISRAGGSINAAMDSFIWSGKPPFDRSPRAWLNYRFQLPYTTDEWRSVFPDGARRLITRAELQSISSYPTARV